MLQTRVSAFLGHTIKIPASLTTKSLTECIQPNQKINQPCDAGIKVPTNCTVAFVVTTFYILEFDFTVLICNKCQTS